jgi:hypothetical protein
MVQPHGGGHGWQGPRPPVATMQLLTRRLHGPQSGACWFVDDENWFIAVRQFGDNPLMVWIAIVMLFAMFGA